MIEGQEAQPQVCPLADNLFDDLAASFLDEETSGELKSTLELFIEQFSTNVLSERLVGIERRTRERLESMLDEVGANEGERANLIAATIDLCREVSAQGYVALAGVVEQYAVPWLEYAEMWVQARHGTCGVMTSVQRCLAAARSVP